MMERVRSGDPDKKTVLICCDGREIWPVVQIDCGVAYAVWHCETCEQVAYHTIGEIDPIKIKFLPEPPTEEELVEELKTKFQEKNRFDPEFLDYAKSHGSKVLNTERRSNDNLQSRDNL